MRKHVFPGAGFLPDTVESLRHGDSSYARSIPDITYYKYTFPNLVFQGICFAQFHFLLKNISETDIYHQIS
ncbi:MAG: hypothetical protein DRI57_31075 [Deltaproteobacteria bacterium]|nr:MAG: hypothetical protein DRI57_31075 [Deltaproteobacteria bacterium]